MNACTVNHTPTRGIYVGSMVARMDGRNRPVEWRQAFDTATAHELADALAELTPDQKFVGFDQYLEPRFADCLR